MKHYKQLILIIIIIITKIITMLIMVHTAEPLGEFILFI